MTDLMKALRFAIQLTEAEGFSECAAGLRAILDRLTQPTDAQIYLTERARAVVHDICPNDFGQGPCDYPACRDSMCEFWKSGDKINAALQFERKAALMDGGEWRTKLAEQIGKTQAAAAEARRAERELIAEWLERNRYYNIADTLMRNASPPAQGETR